MGNTIKTHLNPKLQQKLSLSVALLEGMKLWTIASSDLRALIEKEQLENPFLQINEEASFNSATLVDKEGKYKEDSTGTSNFLTELLLKNKKEFFKKEEKSYSSLYFKKLSKFSSHQQENIKGKKQGLLSGAETNSSSLESGGIETIARSPNLKEHLLEQLGLETDLSHKIISLAELIIAELDEQGFLSKSNANKLIDFLSRDPSHKEQTQKDFKEALLLVQSLDPIACGSSSIKDSLEVQASLLFPDNKNVYKILHEHWHILENLHSETLDSLLEKINMKKKTLEETLSFISRLHPYPASTYTFSKRVLIVPDIILQKKGNIFIPTINGEVLPQLSLDLDYKNLLFSDEMLSTLSKKDTSYLKDKWLKASTLITNIKKRNENLLRIMDYILSHQSKFFYDNPKNNENKFVTGKVIRKEKESSKKYERKNTLRPMYLKDIARELSLHSSTISRLTRLKYVRTPWKTYELKYFFQKRSFSTSNIEQEVFLDQHRHEHDYTQWQVKYLLKKIIAKENIASPVSDKNLVGLLRKKGISLARRTITKYRSSLGIPEASARKKNAS